MTTVGKMVSEETLRKLEKLAGRALVIEEESGGYDEPHVKSRMMTRAEKKEAIDKYLVLFGG